MLEKLLSTFRSLLDQLLKKAPEDAHVIEEVRDKVVIPDEYALRFTLNPLEETSDLVNREEELQMLQQTYENWKITHNPVLLVAEAGTGMTSFLFHAQRTNFPDAILIEDDIHISSHNELTHLLKEKLQLSDVRNLKDIEQELEDKEETLVVIFENVERLFMRRIHGFNLLKDFLLFVHATKRSIYWMITINKYSYYYLDRSMDISSNFLSIIRLQSFRPKHIEQVLLKRNEDLELVFLKPAEMSTIFARRLRSSNDSAYKQTILREHFFNRLYDFAKGNISRSILFWMNSIARITDTKIYLKAFTPKLTGSIPLDELFVLEAIMQHTSLSPKELELVLRQSSKNSKLLLEFLSEKKLVIPKYYDDKKRFEYQINPMYLNEIKQLFHSRLNRNF